MNDYTDIVSYYEKNNHKLMSEWLVFKKMLAKPGKQAKVGILMSKEKDIEFLFKMSRDMNFLIYHECIIFQGLRPLSKYCHNFVRGVGTLKVKIDERTKTENPFIIESKYAIEKEVLLMEYLNNAVKFDSYIRNKKIQEEVLYANIKQVLLAINIAQKEKKFTHYDLHSDNVLLKKCYKDLVIIYKIDEQNVFCVPTLGYYPIIIDYGFSYIEDLLDKPLFASLSFTDIGFTSIAFDPITDYKLFLITVSKEIKAARNTKKSRCLRRIVKNLFYTLDVDFKCGWDNEKKSCSDFVLDLLRIYNDKSRIFQDYDYYCIDLVQSLIILPLEEQEYDMLSNSFCSFIKEWVKIENEISNEYYNLYILKEIINVARDIRSDFLQDDKKKSSVIFFQRRVFEILNTVSTFCVPKNMNFTLFLSSLYVFATSIEGILFYVTNARIQEKKKEYTKMPLKTIEEIFACIDVNMNSPYIYNENTKFCMIDNVLKTSSIHSIHCDHIKTINDTEDILKAQTILKILERSV